MGLSWPSMDIDTSVVKCGDCGSRDLEFDSTRGERFCRQCGTVIETNIVDHTPEWRNFSGEGAVDKSRVGAPITNLLHDKGLSTDIDWRNKDYAGNNISKSSAKQIYRMRRWQQRARVSNTRARNLSQALTRLAVISTKMGLPKVATERAADIYRKTLESEMIRGRSIDVMVAASLFIANQQLQLARTLDDFSLHTKLSHKEIGRTYRDIKRKLRIRTDPPDPKIYVRRFCNELGSDIVTTNKAVEIVDRAGKSELIHGKSPLGVAAAAIYIAGHLTGRIRTQREISEVSGVTEVTVRNRYKQLAESLGIEINV